MPECGQQKSFSERLFESENTVYLEMFRERRKQYPSAIFENRENQILKLFTSDHLKQKETRFVTNHLKDL